MSLSSFRPIEVYTNFLQINQLPTQVYHHYDVIDPESPVKRRNYEVIDRLVAEHASTFNPRPLYDGRKNMYSPRDIQSGEYAVHMRRKSEPTHHVKIRRVSTIDPRAVRMLTRKRDPGDNGDSWLQSLNLLQLIVRQAPNLRHGFPPDARAFFVSANSRDLRVGLAAWRGYFQSVRPALGRVLINIDVAHASVYPPGPLLTVIMDHLGLRNTRELQDLTHQQFAQLRVFLKGVVVSITVAPKIRPKPISDLVREAGWQEFDKDNERYTVEQHFKEKYGVTVRFPQYVGVRIGKTAIIPAEFCEIIPGQLFRKKLPVSAQKAFLEFATQKPKARLEQLKDAVRNGMFNYENSDYMKAAGMSVDPRPLLIQARVIKPPNIIFGGESAEVTNGAWNMVRKRFFQGGEITAWAVAVLDPRADPVKVSHFVRTLARNMHSLGMSIPSKEPPIVSGNPTNPEHTLRQACQALGVKPHLILVFLSANAADCRQAVKNWGDVKEGVVTQCVRSGKWEGAKDQYCNNVALKINARLGGINSSIDSSVSQYLRGSMVIGTDIGHPGPGMNNRPSVAGLVATVDDHASQTTSFVSLQQPRLEVIQDLQVMVQKALDDWRAYRRTFMGKEKPAPPANLFFYRDGVSEGELDNIVQTEIPMIKAAFESVGMPKGMWPKILFVVVGKRHHVRFFPKQPSEGDRSGNCPPGLLVDDQITNPNYQDFYLQSHSGLLGTSRPAHYIVLANEANVPLDKIQTLTYHLCHMYASATRAVSIPAPVYYADRICGRLAFHCDNGAALSDTASNSADSESTFNLEEWKGVFRPSTLWRQKYYL